MDMNTCTTRNRFALDSFRLPDRGALLVELPPCCTANERELAGIAAYDAEGLQWEGERCSTEGASNTRESCDVPEGWARVGPVRVGSEEVGVPDEAEDSQLGVYQSLGPIGLLPWPYLLRPATAAPSPASAASPVMFPQAWVKSHRLRL